MSIHIVWHLEVVGERVDVNKKKKVQQTAATAALQK